MHVRMGRFTIPIRTLFFFLPLVDDTLAHKIA